MAKVIIGIHGLGNKPPKEVKEKWWIESIKEGLKRIGKQDSLPKFELIYWADIFYDHPLNSAISDKKNPYYNDEPYTPASKNFRFKSNKYRLRLLPYIIKYFKKLILNKDFSLKYPQLTESLVDRYFHELEIYYKDRGNKSYSEKKKEVIDRAVRVLKKYKQDDIMLIGHSMGSIIAYDILSYELPEIKIKTLVTIGSPLGQPFVISKIASRQDLKQYESAKLKTPSSIISNWYNFSDIEDTVALNYKLADEFCENSMGVKPTDILINNDYIILNEHNPHKSFGYLRAREFSEIMSAFIEEKRPGLLSRAFSGLKKVFYKIKAQ